MRLRDLDNEGRRDVSWLTPDKIDVLTGFNLRPRDAVWEAKVREYADDMKVRGFRSEFPIVIRTKGVDRPVLVSGHTRHAAAVLAISEGAPFKGIPCVPEEEGANDATRIATMLVEPGTKLPPLAIAEGVRRMMAFLHKETLVAEQLNKSVSWVKDQLILSSAPAEVRDAVETHETSASNAVAMTRKGDLAATIELRQARANLPAGKKRITAKTITKATPKPATPRLTPEQKAIQRHLAVWRTWSARTPVRALLTPEIEATIAELDEQVPHKAEAA